MTATESPGLRVEDEEEEGTEWTVPAKEVPRMVG